jgi:DNA-binding XRE family transcriptional regulator
MQLLERSMKTNVVEKSDRKNTTFMIRFNQLRGDRSQAAFGKLLGLSAATIGFYENGERLPNAADLLRIATVCGVSTDWLLGLSDVKNPDATLQGVCAYTGLDEGAVELLHNKDYSPLLDLVNALLTVRFPNSNADIISLSMIVYNMRKRSEALAALTPEDLERYRSVSTLGFVLPAYQDLFLYKIGEIKKQATRVFAVALDALTGAKATLEHLGDMEADYREYLENHSFENGGGDHGTDEEHP